MAFVKPYDLHAYNDSTDQQRTHWNLRSLRLHVRRMYFPGACKGDTKTYCATYGHGGTTATDDCVAYD